jgi:DNA-binding NarL/FixJ family response regulator
VIPNRAEIAIRLVISESTVKSHVQAILRKLEVRNRTQPVAWFLQQKSLVPGDISSE